MQHLVIKDVAQKPQRHERLVKCRIDPNDPIFLLYCSKNELLSWAVLASAAPDDLVAAKTSTEIAIIQIVKDGAKIEMRSLMTQIQVALHRQLRESQLSFCFFLLLSHEECSKNDESQDYFSGLQI